MKSGEIMKSKHLAYICEDGTNSNYSDHKSLTECLISYYLSSHVYIITKNTFTYDTVSSMRSLFHFQLFYYYRQEDRHNEK